jgi:hypothetical protein
MTITALALLAIALDVMAVVAWIGGRSKGGRS